MEKEEIAASLDAIQDPVSLQEPVYNDGTENIFVMDQVKDTKNNDENWAETMTINEALKSADPYSIVPVSYTHLTLPTT